MKAVKIVLILSLLLVNTAKLLLAQNCCIFNCPNCNLDPIPQVYVNVTLNGCSSITIDPFANSNTVVVNCCNALQVCYGTCGKSKSKCDAEFLICSLSACSDLDLVCKASLNTLLALINTGPTVCQLYLTNQKTGCIC